ncbi:D-methionine transport system ATP-binding protein [Polaromonas sp. CG_9.5]|uniref:methionine ABC transporter ATP-binding protein n=1 Tax=Polaromonas sp. CG_9.5 TaxID=3071705 RepID=UPI002E077A29|nr:D-methionine transport system ATP-binding protein [Polaromonas sp. CG_9.5]
MIHLKNVHKSYVVKDKQIPALSGIDLSIVRGEIFGVIGHSGAGKSTLVRLINLLERPSGGEIIVDGEAILAYDNLALRNFRRNIGMIFQHFNLLSSKTVAENVAFPIRIAGERDTAKIDARVDEMLDLVGLSRHKHKYPKQLSGGEKQRVGIARALANRPKILLCDEATSALDPQTTRSILQLLREINEKLDLTIVLITHEMDVIRTICDRVAVIDGGKIVESGPVTQVFLHPRHPTTRNFVMEAEDLSEDEFSEGLNQTGEGMVRRLTFMNESMTQPVFTRIARQCEVDFLILNGRFGKIKSTPCGQLTVAFKGDTENALAAIQQLAEAGVVVEESF